MRYKYEFKEDSFGDLEIVLPEKIRLFSDFIGNIATEDQIDEYIEYIKNVLEGVYEDFEIELNAISIFIKKISVQLQIIFGLKNRIEIQLKRSNL